MLMCYGEAQGNASLALNIYRARFPNARHPRDPRVIVRAFQRVSENQPAVPRREGAGRPVRATVARHVLAAVRQNPRLGIRTTARLLFNRHRIRVSHWTVHKILRRDRQRAYHVHKVHALLPTDGPRRVEFCHWFLQQHDVDPTFAANVIWTDESMFTRNGMWNRRNSHIWAHTNPYVMQQTAHQNPWALNVWAGMYKSQILGPVFLPLRLNGPSYLQLLNSTIEGIVDEMPLADRRNAWFQHDGAPAHITDPVRRYLSQTFGDQWIGRFGPQSWPARSPDLTPLDFFLWGYIKNKVFVTECPSAAQMRDRIESAFTTLRAECARDPNFLPRVQNDIVRRAQICVQVDGGHFEPHLVRNNRD